MYVVLMEDFVDNGDTGIFGAINGLRRGNTSIVFSNIYITYIVGFPLHIYISAYSVIH